MSKCRDCLHYLVCSDSEGKIIRNCHSYIDRSEWVHLPYKVGDKIYQTDGIRTYESTIGKIDISSTNTVYCTENISFDERAIGNSIFLTREEAEKALEGMK